MKKLVVMFAALCMGLTAFAQTKTIKAENIHLEGSAAQYFTIPDGEYTLKAKGDQLIFSFYLQKIKDFDRDQYIKDHPKIDKNKHLTFSSSVDESICLYDEDGFRVTNQDELKMSNYNNESLFVFLTNGAVGDKILVKCSAATWTGRVEEEDLTALMQKNVTDVSVRNFNIRYDF